MYRSTLLWLMALVVVWSGSARADIAAAPFALKDQFDEWRCVSVPSERVVVLVFADRVGSEQLEEWVIPLGERYGQRVDIHGVATLDEVPRILRPVVRAAFKLKIGYPVMLDWTGEISGQYAYEALLANVVVIEPSGRITHRVHGASSPERLKQFFEQVDALLDTSTPHEE